MRSRSEAVGTNFSLVDSLEPINRRRERLPSASDGAIGRRGSAGRATMRGRIGGGKGTTWWSDQERSLTIRFAGDSRPAMNA
jgi:hypothetical protein